MGLFRRFAGVQPAEAVVLLADFAINTGFFMLIPYLSVHIRDNLLLSATVAGTVLAVRTGVQQVLMIFAGPMADLFGYKRMLIIGLLVRAVGFMSFALMNSVTGLLVSSVLSGLGGALFSASARATWAALNPGPNQSSRFAVLYTAQSFGTTIGPLLGALLLSLDFRVLSLAAGFVYLPIAVLIFMMLPNLDTGRVRPATGGAAGAEVLHSIRTVARNRYFVTYCLISAGFWTLNTQMNISLSLYAASITGSQTAVKYLLLTNSLLVIALQYKVNQWTSGRWAPVTQLAAGTAAAGVAFLLLVPFPGMGGLLACVVVMSLAGMLVRPNDYQMIIGMAPRDSLASYYGFSALAMALGGSGGQFLGGRLTDLAQSTGLPWLPWVCFAAIAAVASLAMVQFGRRAPADRNVPA